MKVALVAFYDTDSFAVRTLSSILKKENIEVHSLFFKTQSPCNSSNIPTEKDISVFVDYVKENKFDIIGFSVRSFTFGIAKS